MEIRKSRVLIVDDMQINRIVLLDHRMPELDGVDTLVRLKELFKERGKDVPIICHTTEEGRSNAGSSGKRRKPQPH